MKKSLTKKNVILAIVLSSLTMNSFAEYVAEFRLEQSGGGRLPDGSIIIGNGNNPPITPTDPAGPTDCEFNSSTGYILQDSTVTKVYNNVIISNGSRGEMVQELPEYNVIYYKLCMNGETPIPVGAEPPEEGWTADDCRYNMTGSKYQYYWTDTNAPTEYPGQLAFSSAFLGDLGFISYAENNINFPAGTITTSRGNILPSADSSVGRGSVLFSKGALQTVKPSGDGGTLYYYEVCKVTVH